MKSITALLMIALLLQASGLLARDIDRFDDLGDTWLYPVADARGLVLILADSKTVDDPAPQLARRLNASGLAVALVNFDNFLNRASAGHWPCLNAVTLLDVYGQHLQDSFHFSQFRRPLLLGLGQGAAIAYLLLQQAPGNLFQGAVSVGFCPDLQLPAPPCQETRVTAWDPVGTSAYRLRAMPTPAPWVMIQDRDTQCGLAMPEFALQAVAVVANTPDALDDAVAKVLAASAAHVTAVDDLPLVELAVPHPARDFLAIVISGDGGWADIDQDIGRELNRRGVPVVGWNSLKYFWNRKTPEQTAADLVRVMEHYREQWRLPRVVLIGYSIGADVIPFMLSRIEPRQRHAISGVALLALSHAMDFEFHVTNWLGGPSRQTQAIAPELQKFDDVVIQCFYGADDDDMLCPELKGSQYTIIRKPGDHHFDGDYNALVDAILRAHP